MRLSGRADAEKAARVGRLDDAGTARCGSDGALPDATAVDASLSAGVGAAADREVLDQRGDVAEEQHVASGGKDLGRGGWAVSTAAAS